MAKFANMNFHYHWKESLDSLARVFGEPSAR
jgi:hypothetical protein